MTWWLKKPTNTKVVQGTGKIVTAEGINEYLVKRGSNTHREHGHRHGLAARGNRLALRNWGEQRRQYEQRVGQELFPDSKGPWKITRWS